MIKTANNKIATEPFPELHVKMAVQSAFAVVEQKGSLQALKVLFSTEDGSYEPGDTVYVQSEMCKHPAAANVVALGEQKCILLEKNMVVACKKGS